MIREQRGGAAQGCAIGMVVGGLIWLVLIVGALWWFSR